MKRRNPRFGYLRIAMQISGIFGIKIDDNVVKRVLDKHYKPSGGGDGPSWLTFIGHMQDSLWSVDFFRVESILLKSHWVMVVMDQFTRRIIGFSTHQGDVDGVAACRMFGEIISKQPLPTYLSSDNDPIFQFHRWKANLRVLDIKEIKSLPVKPTSHPFIERLIGTIRREYLDHLLCWNKEDLQRKLYKFKDFYNSFRYHQNINWETPEEKLNGSKRKTVNIQHYRWQKHSCGVTTRPVPH